MALAFSGDQYGGNYLTQASALVAAAPMTFSCWVNLTKVTVNQFIMGIATSTTGSTSYFAMELIGASSKMCAAIRVAAGTTDVTALTTGTLSTNTWYHVACVFTSTASRTCYLNGVAGTTSVVSLTPATIDSSYIGNIKFNGLVSSGASGSVASPGIWKVALSAADVLSLSQGCSPRVVVPNSLVSFVKISDSNSPEPDVVSGAWTVVTF